MYNLNTQYQNLLKNILNEGEINNNILSLVGTQISYEATEGLPISTTKTSILQQVVAELKWALKGDITIKYLIDNNCNSWNDVAYEFYKKNYKLLQENYSRLKIDDIDLYKSIFKDKILLSKEEYIKSIKTNDLINEDFNFSDIWGNLGPIYSRQLKNQLILLSNFLKNPSLKSNSHIVNFYNVEDVPYMASTPRHYSFQCCVINNKLNLIWNQSDINANSEIFTNLLLYGLLLLLLCKEFNLEPGKVVGSFGNIYLNNSEIEEVKNNLDKKLFDFLKIELDNVDIKEGKFNYTLM